MNRTKISLTGLILTVCIASVGMAASTARQDPPVWSPDKTLQSQLAVEPEIVADYEIQGPAGWEPQLRGGPGKIGREWDGPNDANGNHPFVEMMAMGLPDWGIDKRTPADFLDLRLNNVKNSLTDYKPSKFEDGMINGIPFARCRFTGTTMVNPIKIAGFMYVGREGTYVVEVRGEESADKAARTLPLLEAVAMTLRKHLKPLAEAPAGGKASIRVAAPRGRGA